jgi:RNA polymerase subunit RPABC4/transcription elongation factor Spt4
MSILNNCIACGRVAAIGEKLCFECKSKEKTDDYTLGQ